MILAEGRRITITELSPETIAEFIYIVATFRDVVAYSNAIKTTDQASDVVRECVEKAFEMTKEDYVSETYVQA